MICDNCPYPYKKTQNCKYNIEFKQFDHTEISSDLLEAILEFYNNDFDLLNRKANEVCITSHIFHYFSSKFKDKYYEYDIDPEYNRNGEYAKYYCEDGYAKPDLIIHKRNCNKHNLVYIEFKKHRDLYDEKDLNKIIKFVSNEIPFENGKRLKPYRYKYGVSILLNSRDIKMLWYKNGETEPFENIVFDVKEKGGKYEIC